MVPAAEGVYEQELAECSTNVRPAMMATWADLLSTYEEGKRVAALHTADEAHKFRPAQDACERLLASLAIEVGQRFRMMEGFVPALH